MIDELKLFRSMIKYHPTMIGWLIKNKKVEKLDDKLVIYSPKKVQSPYIQSYRGEVYLTNNDGSKRIPGGSWDKNFTKIKLLCGNFKELVVEGFEIFDLNNSCDRYCLTSQLGKLLVSHYDILGDFWFPKDFPRFKGKEALAYIKWLENKHEYLKKRDYRFDYDIYYSIYIGASGFSNDQPVVVENIKKFGIFAYKPIYKEIEWTFDLVEKYKDKIVWERLMDDSNLIWEEEMLDKYEKYIPYKKNENGPKYAYADYSSQKLEDYSHLGFLSNNFLQKHMDVLDWREVLEKCKFNWDKDDIVYFCSYILSHDEKYELYDVEILLDNAYFIWDAQKLYAYLSLNNAFWNDIKQHKKIHAIFMQIPNVKKLAAPYVKDENFWDIVSYAHEFDYDELSKIFTIDKIKENLTKWSTPIKNKFIGMRRTPDTNYHYYMVITKWDELYMHENVPLTYELAKYLQSIDITIGGTYCESDGGYLEEDYRNQVYNGLKLFTSHHIESEDDIIKIVNDITLLESFLKLGYSCNEDIISYMINVFFSKTNLQDYLDIVNQMKEWDTIRNYE